MTKRESRTLLIAASLFAAVGACGPARAADLGDYRVDEGAPADGVPCGSPELASFPSIWQGHFAGGIAHYLGPGRTVALDWRDEKLCFPSHASCNRYVFGMRRNFHRPEGYFTCLLIR